MAWSLPRFDHLVRFAGASHVGNVRTNNEDGWRVEPSFGIFAVADGMGGHAAGEVASALAIDTLVENLQTSDAVQRMDQYVESASLDARRSVFATLSRAAQSAHAAILSEAERTRVRKGMGCTLDVALLLRSHGFIAHVGDGRTYLSRPSTTIQLTDDHTLTAALIARGVATPSHPPGGGNALVNAVGRGGKITVDEIFIELSEGDRLVLCTDGVHGELGDEAVLTSLARQGRPEDTALALIDGALARGGRDNATALVVEVAAQHVERAGPDCSPAEADALFASQSTLLEGASRELQRRALAAAVQVQFKPGELVPRFQTEDRVAYIVLDGNVITPDGWMLGPSSVIYPESLAGGKRSGALFQAREPVRALRIRSGDFKEVCDSDVVLGAALYERLARSLARMVE